MTTQLFITIDDVNGQLLLDVSSVVAVSPTRDGCTVYLRDGHLVDCGRPASLVTEKLSEAVTGDQR